MLVLPLRDRHDRPGFDCGDDDLNRWFAQVARQHKEKGDSSTFVAVTDEASAEVLGYYAISLAELVNAKPSAVGFYQHYSFEQMADHPLNLLLLI